MVDFEIFSGLFLLLILFISFQVAKERKQKNNSENK